MNKLNSFMKIVFSLTLFGPCIILLTSALFVELNYSITAIIALVGGVVGYLLLPLLPFMRLYVNFLATVMLFILTGKMVDSSKELCISACCAIILILPFIGAFFVKSKPTVYRLFVYLPIIGSIICNKFFCSVDVSWANPVITDIVYLILAIILDISVSRKKIHQRETF